jgi:predicted nucleic acid-binding protein
MTLLVVDSSVVIKWFVDEPYSSEAKHVLSGYGSGDFTFLAPDLLNAEIGNIVWKKQRVQGLAATDAEQIIAAFRRLDFQFTSTADLLNDAYHLAVEHQRTVYDMLYVALCIREKCSFVTADEKLANALPADMRSIVWLGNWIESTG